MAGDWQTKTLEEIAEPGEHGFVDGPFGSNLPASSYTDVGVPVIRGSNLSLGVTRFDDSTFVFVLEETANRLQRSCCKPLDIIFTKKGTIGQTGLVPPYGCYERYLLSSNQMKLSVDRTVADPLFVYYFVSSPESRDKVLRDSEATGVPKTNLAYFRKFPIPLPPLPEQKAIAHILGTLDDKIELNRRMNETLEGIARALFKSWFVDFDPVRAKMDGRPVPGLDAATAALFPGGFAESELGHIPKGWKVGSIGDVGDNPRRGIAPDSIPEGTAYIALEHMPRRSIALCDWDVADEIGSTKCQFRRGEILFGKLRPYFHKVGVPAVDGICSTDILVIAARTPTWFGLLLGHMSSDEFVSYTDMTSTGTKMPRTNWKDIARFEIVLPPEDIAEVFGAKMRAIVGQMHANIHHSRTLASLRDALLPKLLSGEIRIGRAQEEVRHHA